MLNKLLLDHITRLSLRKGINPVNELVNVHIDKCLTILYNSYIIRVVEIQVEEANILALVLELGLTSTRVSGSESVFAIVLASYKAWLLV